MHVTDRICLFNCLIWANRMKVTPIDILRITPNIFQMTESWFIQLISSSHFLCTFICFRIWFFLTCIHTTQVKFESKLDTLIRVENLFRVCFKFWIAVWSFKNRLYECISIRTITTYNLYYINTEQFLLASMLVAAAHPIAFASGGIYCVKYNTSWALLICNEIKWMNLDENSVRNLPTNWAQADWTNWRPI